MSETKRIPLRGKYAVGEHAFAIVDADDYELLVQFNWKAKPNQGKNHVYAVRAVKGEDGKTRDVRMHRVVLNYDGPLDVDHINRNALDNRKENLRVVTRSVNARNTVLVEPTARCHQCGASIERRVKLGNVRLVRYCSDACDREAERERDRARPKSPSSAPSVRPCKHCGKDALMIPSSSYCSSSCRQRAKYARKVKRGVLSPSMLRRAETARRWRESRKGRA